MADPKTAAPGEKTGHKNEKVGQVVAAKMAKTIVVIVERRSEERRVGKEC